MQTLSLPVPLERRRLRGRLLRQLELLDPPVVEDEPTRVLGDAPCGRLLGNAPIPKPQPPLRPRGVDGRGEEDEHLGGGDKVAQEGLEELCMGKGKEERVRACALEGTVRYAHACSNAYLKLPQRVANRGQRMYQPKGALHPATKVPRVDDRDDVLVE